MFAIALYDTRLRLLHLYRDRLGKKPLFYSLINGKLYFGSEIKSIISCSDFKRECNYAALDYILSYNYIPNDMTAFKNIYKLMPGEHMVISFAGIKKNKYWDLQLNYTYENDNIPERVALEDIDSLLDDSVKIRLRSDVPVGAFLSGGVDSSFVVANALSHVDNIDTFSIGFAEKKYDESPYSREVARILKTNHHEKIVDSKFFEYLPTTIWLNDNPHGDVSFLPSFVLANMTAQHVKTVLTGDGGDELFGGYDKYIKYANSDNKSILSFFETNSVFSNELKKSLYKGKMNEIHSSQDTLSYIKNIMDRFQIRDDCSTIDNINIILYLETKLLLEGNNLVKPDRMGMGNSLEARMPLMDYRLVEYVSSLPSSLKIKDGVTKYLFKKIASKRLPENIVYRKKQMFTVPIGEWFKDSLRDMMYGVLLSERTLDRGLFDPDFTRKMLDAHVAEKENYTRQLRLLFIIELWHRIYIDDLYVKPPKLIDVV